MDFKRKAEIAAALVARGIATRKQAEQALGLQPGEHLCPNGVISGSGAHPGIPRHGTDETE
jgi:hypothetical protein